MALLNFNYGLVKDLPAERVDGNLYITTDSQGLYVDLEGVRTHVSDFIQVESQEALEALGTYYPQVFYYVSGSNALLKYTSSGWKQLNSTSALSAELSALEERVRTNETNIAGLNTTTINLNTRIDNLNATDVETTKEITVTTTVGNYAKGSKISADTDLQTLILNMLCKDSNPVTSQPSISVTLNGAGAKEVGTSFTPSYTINTNSGSYVANGANQPTNVTFSNYEATEYIKDVAGAAKTTKNGSFAAFVVADDTKYQVKATADHSDGDIPKTYLGNNYPSGQIKAASLGIVTSGVVTGYRPIFYGMTTSIGTLTSADIRGLTKINSKPAAQKVKFIAANLAGVKRFLVAIPTSTGLGVTKAIITSSMNADATNDYKKIGTVQVEGANNYATTASYDIWAYAPASIANTEVHEVTIG